MRSYKTRFNERVVSTVEEIFLRAHTSQEERQGPDALIADCLERYRKGIEESGEDEMTLEDAAVSVFGMLSRVNNKPDYSPKDIENIIVSRMGRNYTVEAREDSRVQKIFDMASGDIKNRKFDGPLSLIEQTIQKYETGELTAEYAAGSIAAMMLFVNSGQHLSVDAIKQALEPDAMS